MSDSDDDAIPHKEVFAYENETTMVSAHGPKTNYSNMGASFRNNFLSSKRPMPPTFKTPYEDFYSQTIPRREVSPMSVRSVCDARQRRLENTFNYRAPAPKSIYNGRAGSSMSVRSIDTTASISAMEIANAFKTEHFSKHELRVIKEAYQKHLKQKMRRKIDKRRYRKYRRRTSGYDSGEQGSNSSTSSDDTTTRDNQMAPDYMSSGRSAITDISNIRRTIQNSHMYNDCTDKLKHSLSHRGVGNLNRSQISVTSSRSMFPGSSMHLHKPIVNFNESTSHKKPQSSILLKDRFTNGYLLPSSRFNNKVLNSNSQNIKCRDQSKLSILTEIPMAQNKISTTDNNTDSEDEPFFCPVQKPNSNIQRKRSIDCDDNNDVYYPNEKRHKPLSPCKNFKAQNTQSPDKDNDNDDDFIFAKPTFPVMKPVKEKLISKSAASIVEIEGSQIVPPANVKLGHDKPTNEVEKEIEPTDATQNTTNLSMKPSFIKRKLFTQKIDVTEKVNISTDSSNSPQNSMYSTIQKERKARKLQQVTTQSCLNRDLQHDDNNLLDLIQKIVPKDKINVSNPTNRSDRQSKNATEDNSNKWDVSSIIEKSSRPKNDDDVSDTYTDEEVLNSTVRELQKHEKAKKTPVTTKVTNNKLQKETLGKRKTVENNLKNKQKVSKENEKSTPKVNHLNDKENIMEEKCFTKKNIKEITVNDNESSVDDNILQQTNSHIFKMPPPAKPKLNIDKLPANVNLQPIKSFWDTDFESDVECKPSTKINNSNKRQNLTSVSDSQANKPPKKNGLFNVFNFKKPALGSNDTFQSNILDKMPKFSTSTLKIRSHRYPKRNKFDKIDPCTICELEPEKPKVCSTPEQLCKEKFQDINHNKKSPIFKNQFTEIITKTNDKLQDKCNTRTKKQQTEVAYKTNKKVQEGKGQLKEVTPKSNDKLKHNKKEGSFNKNGLNGSKSKPKEITSKISKKSPLRKKQPVEVISNKNDKLKDTPKAKTKKQHTEVMCKNNEKSRETKGQLEEVTSKTENKQKEMNKQSQLCKKQIIVTVPKISDTLQDTPNTRNKKKQNKNSPEGKCQIKQVASKSNEKVTHNKKDVSFNKKESKERQNESTRKINKKTPEYKKSQKRVTPKRNKNTPDIKKVQNTVRSKRLKITLEDTFQNSSLDNTPKFDSFTLNIKTSRYPKRNLSRSNLSSKFI